MFHSACLLASATEAPAPSQQGSRSRRQCWRFAGQRKAPSASLRLTGRSAGVARSRGKRSNGVVDGLSARACCAGRCPPHASTGRDCGDTRRRGHAHPAGRTCTRAGGPRAARRCSRGQLGKMRGASAGSPPGSGRHAMRHDLSASIRSRRAVVGFARIPTTTPQIVRERSVQLFTAQSGQRGVRALSLEFVSSPPTPAARSAQARGGPAHPWLWSELRRERRSIAAYLGGLACACVHRVGVFGWQPWLCRGHRSARLTSAICLYPKRGGTLGGADNTQVTLVINLDDKRPNTGTVHHHSIPQLSLSIPLYSFTILCHNIHLHFVSARQTHFRRQARDVGRGAPTGARAAGRARKAGRQGWPNR